MRALPKEKHILAIVLVGSLWTACSLDGFTGGSNPPPGNDGGDGGSPDTDGGDTDAPPGFCERLDPRRTFCDDFDTGIVGWTDIVQNRGATASGSAGFLLVTIPEDNTGPGAMARVKKTFARIPNSIHLEYLLSVPQPAGQEQGHPTIVFEQVRANGRSEVLFLLDKDMARAKAYERAGDGTVIGTPWGRNLPEMPLKGDGWVRVNIDLTMGPGPRLRIRGEGNEVLPSTDLPGIGFVKDGPIDVYVGIREAAIPSVGWQLRFDDVSIDVK